MQTRPPPGTKVDQLVVGALAIDRLADGSDVAGGTVVHATRALALAGRTIGVLTVAGPEPAALAALRDLRTTATVEVQPSSATTTFAIEERGADRRLTLLARSAPIVAGPYSLPARSTLFGPLAAELGPDLAGHETRSAVMAAVLQGWLRHLEPGRAVEPMPLRSLSAALVARLATFALLVASVDDLAADGTDLPRLLGELRATFGPAPALAVTAGADGAWVELPGGERDHVAVPRVVRGVSTVGAGDGFAALMLDGLARGLPALDAANAAAEGVADLLAARLDRRPP